MANLLILGFIYFTYGYIKSRNDVYEANVVNVESKMQELLVNFDKVIYRAQSSPELSKFDKVIDTCIESAIRFYNMSYAYSISSSSLVLTTVCVMNYLFLGKTTRNEISPVQFITFFSMLIVYRDKMTGFIQEIPDMIEMFGRGETVLEKLDEKGFKLDKKHLVKFVPIKELGQTEVTCQLLKDVTAQFKVEVVSENPIEKVAE